MNKSGVVPEQVLAMIVHEFVHILIQRAVLNSVHECATCRQLSRQTPAKTPCIDFIIYWNPPHPSQSGKRKSPVCRPHYQFTLPKMAAQLVGKCLNPFNDCTKFYAKVSTNVTGTDLKEMKA